MSNPLAVPLCALLAAAALSAQQQFDDLRRVHLPPSVGDVWALASFDADGDGDRDLLVGRYAEPSAIWRNDGFGTFVTQGPIGALVASETTTAFAVGDVDGDGVEDVFWATGNGLRLLLGSTLYDAPSGFLPPVATATGVASLALFDVDSDQDLDLVYGESGGVSAGYHLLVNDGTGRFSDATTQWLGAVGASGAVANQLVPFDCDGDQDLDLLLGSWNAAPRLLRNQGATFVLAPTPTTVARSFALAVGDVDGDGDADVVVGTQSSNPQLRQDRLWRNAGGGAFVDDTAASLPTIDNFTTGMHLTDLDGDGDLDLLVAHQRPTLFGNRLGHSLLRNDGAGVFSDASSELPDNDLAATWSVVMDVDGDGDDDYLFSTLDRQRLYWNDGGTLIDADGPAVPYRAALSEGVAAGDLDGDGLPELLTAGQNFSILGGRNTLLWNDGAGRFVERATNPVWPLGLFSSVALGDVDGDGDLDVVYGLDGPARNLLFRNGGNGALTDVTTTSLPAVNDITAAVALFDRDGDGDLDLLFANRGGPSRLLDNNGAGVFADVPGGVPGGSARAVAVGDVDGDGDPDLVVANDQGPNALWLNSGGVFTVAAGRLPATAQATMAVALADVDADQDLDLIVGNAPAAGFDPRSWLLRNDGTGTFLSAPIGLGALDVRAIAAGDLEGDGDVDFVLGGLDTAPRLFENQGGGVFVAQAASMPAGARNTYALALADVDGDGDLDLFEGDGGPDRLLTNLHRQLRGRQLLVPGTTAAYEVTAIGGPAGAVPFAALSLGAVGAPVPTPFGTARLDLATFVPVAVLALPPSAPSATWSLSVPANPALAGFAVAAQAVVAHDATFASWRLSGLVLETVR